MLGGGEWARCTTDTTGMGPQGRLSCCGASAAGVNDAGRARLLREAQASPAVGPQRGGVLRRRDVRGGVSCHGVHRGNTSVLVAARPGPARDRGPVRGRGTWPGPAHKEGPVHRIKARKRVFGRDGKVPSGTSAGARSNRSRHDTGDTRDGAQRRRHPDGRRSETLQRCPRLRADFNSGAPPRRQAFILPDHHTGAVMGPRYWRRTVPEWNHRCRRISSASVPPCRGPVRRAPFGGKGPSGLGATCSPRSRAAIRRGVPVGGARCAARHGWIGPSAQASMEDLLATLGRDPRARGAGDAGVVGLGWASCDRLACRARQTCDAWPERKAGRIWEVPTRAAVAAKEATDAAFLSTANDTPTIPSPCVDMLEATRPLENGSRDRARRPTSAANSRPGSDPA